MLSILHFVFINIQSHINSLRIHSFVNVFLYAHIFMQLRIQDLWIGGGSLDGGRGGGRPGQMVQPSVDGN